MGLALDVVTGTSTSEKLDKCVNYAEDLLPYYSKTDTILTSIYFQFHCCS